MNRDRIHELLVVVSLIGGFARISAVSTIGENHGLSFELPPGDA